MGQEKTSTPLTRNLEGLQRGAAVRIASIAVHYPVGIRGQHHLRPDFDSAREAYAQDAVLWAVEIIKAAEAKASEIPPAGEHGLPDFLMDQ